MPVSVHRRRAAAQAQDRDRAAIDRIALKASTPVLNSLQRIPLKAWMERRGRVSDLKAAISHHLLAFAPTLRDSMLTAYLRGRWQSVSELREHTGRKVIALGKYDDAVEFLLQRLALDDSEVESITNQFGQNAVKILNGATDELENKLHEAVTDTITSGVHVKGGIAKVRDAFDKAGVAPDNSFTIETIVRTEIQKAYGAGKWQADQAPDMQEYLWGYVYTTVGDARVRETHEEMDGATAPRFHPVWQQWWPPCGWNCRCACVKVYKDEEPETELPDPLPVPDEGFGFNFGEIFRI